MKIEQVPINKIINTWPRVREWLNEANAISEGEVTEEVMLANLLLGRWILVTIKDDLDITIAACTCDISTFASGKRVLLVGTIGGSQIENWLDDLHAELTDVAEKLNVDAVYINGRPGWEKILKKYNFRKIYSTYVRNGHGW